jgi:hypothetical protein
MSQWDVVIACYALVAAGIVLLLGWSWAAMRRAEREAERLGSRR